MENRKCVDCGADISDLHHRNTRCKACQKKHKAEEDLAFKRKQAEAYRAAKVCPLCGKSLAGQIGQRVYCTACRPFVQGGKLKALESPEAREARIAAKLARERARTAKVLDEIMNGKPDPRDRVDEAVETETDAYTGMTVSWRGQKVSGNKACDVKHKNW